MSEDGNQDSRVAELEAELARAKEEASGYKTQASEIQSRFAWCKDPAQAQKNLEEFENLRKGGNKEDVDALIAEKVAEARASLQSEIDGLNNNLSTANNQLKEYQVTEQVFKIAASVFNEDCYDDVKGYIRRYCDVDEKGNIVVKDDKGNIRFEKGSANKPMSPQQYIEELAANKPSWAKSNMIKGTKDGGEGYKGGASLSPEKYKQLPKEEKIRYFNGLPMEEKKKLFRELYQ